MRGVRQLKVPRADITNLRLNLLMHPKRIDQSPTCGESVRPILPSRKRTALRLPIAMIRCLDLKCLSSLTKRAIVGTQRSTEARGVFPQTHFVVFSP
jgi:hypothetical protein